jgi:Heavy metal associated domain 2
VQARVIRLVHSLPGRLRLRLAWLRGEEEEATALAEMLARLGGMVRVTVRPYTGSVLCDYEPAEIDERAILEAVKAETGVRMLLRASDPEPKQVSADERAAVEEGTTIAKAVARAFRQINLDLLQATSGRLDLGTLMSLGFLSAGFVQLVRQRRIPVPPWFNLAWWAFRTFTEAERKAIASAARMTPLGEEPQL